MPMCWTTRLEALTGADDAIDGMARLTPAQWADAEALRETERGGADCGWEGPPRGPHDGDCHSFYCVCLLRVLEALCVLDAGHAGPHDFADTRDVVLRFPAEPAG